MIVRIKKTENYTVIHNECLRNIAISARAKGVYSYLMSLPNNWKLKRKEIFTHFSEGRDSLNAAFKELEKHGYIIKERVKAPKSGKFIGWEYRVYELSISPIDGNSADQLENRNTGNQPPGNPPLLNTNKVNTKLNTNKDNMPTPVGTAPLLKENELDVPIEVENIIRKCILSGKFTDHLKYKYRSTKTRELSKTFTTIVRSIIQINLGTFLSNRELDEEWVKKQNIVKLPPDRGYNDWYKVEKLLLKSTDRAGRARKAGKEYVPTSLLEFLYNPETKKSRFLYFLNNLGFAGDEMKIQGMKKNLSVPIQEMIESFLKKTKLMGNQLLQFWSNMVLLNTWYKNNQKALSEYNREHHDNGFGYHCGTARAFFKMALFYLENECGGFLPARPLPPDRENQMWQKFRAYMLNSFNVEINV